MGIGKYRGDRTRGLSLPEHHSFDDKNNGEQLTTDNRELPLLLIVEDNNFLQAYLETLLTPYYRVAIASDGVEGLEKAKSLQPNLIVSDQVMPRQNGLDLLKEIRSTPELSSTPVIFLTARSGMESRIESLDAGADDYIAKPFDERELLARVRNLLRSPLSRTAVGGSQPSVAAAETAVGKCESSLAVFGNLRQFD